MLCALVTVSQGGEPVIELPRADLNKPISIAADSVRQWQQGAYDVRMLSGNCYINQGLTYARCRQAVLWIERDPNDVNRPTTVITYLEGNVDIRYHKQDKPNDQTTGRITDKSWFGRFRSHKKIQFRLPKPAGQPEKTPALFHRGMAHFDPQWGRSIQRTEYSQPVTTPPPTDVLPPGTRRIRAFPRSDVPIQAKWFPSGTSDEWVAVIDSGVNLIVDGMDTVIEGIGPIDAFDVSTDRMVIWTAGIQPDLSGQLQNQDTPLEIYLEGNIVFRQGDRVIYADQMYYDVRRRMGVILNAELLTPAPDIRGLVRLKAGVLRQLDAARFVGQDALITTSQMGQPGYYFKSKTIDFQDLQISVVDPYTGSPQLDPQTGEPFIEHRRLARSFNNFLYVDDIPVFYWPVMATNLKKSSYYVNQFQLRNDRIFGTQVLLGLDGYQLFGIRDPPEGTNWDLSVDYLSKRGLGYGTSFEYDRPSLLGIPGPTFGNLDAWFIKDRGVDNLGYERREVPPEADYRGRVFWHHRQVLNNNLTLSAELGWISDRNFLEEYFKSEWDDWKNLSTAIELKQIFDNQAFGIVAQTRLNPFLAQTEWLPRGDHFWIGQPLLGDRLTWFEHSHASYAHMRPASIPTDPQQAAITHQLPYVDVRRQGARLATRQELDLPFSLGPFKVVPYALGQLALWGEDIDKKAIQRAFYQTGARASIPFWAVNPTVENRLLNVHGLAHKIVFDAEFSYAQSNRNLNDFPLYDPINDNNIQAFERFFYPVPPQLDPRFYAKRTGIQGWVTSPTTEIVDDLTALRMGMRHRWQTKRGWPSEQRIIDWIILDMNAVYFPDPDRDNFGEDLGLVNYKFRWYVGDRLTLVSDGGFDFFSEALRTVSVGGFLTRPPRGSLYTGFRSFTGPFESSVLNASYSYWMTPKWISTLGSSIDFGKTGNSRQTFSLTRIGESLLVTLGCNYNQSKDNFGVNLIVEPRFLTKTRISNVPGIQLPPVDPIGLD